MQYKDIEDALSEFDAISEQNTAKFTFITSQIENLRQRIAASNEETVKFEGEISRCDHHAFVERIFKVERSAEQMPTCYIIYCRTHNLPPESFL